MVFSSPVGHRNEVQAAVQERQFLFLQQLARQVPQQGNDLIVGVDVASPSYGDLPACGWQISRLNQMMPSKWSIACG